MRNYLTKAILILGLLACYIVNGQTISWLQLNPTVPFQSDSVLLIVASYYNFGGGGQGPRAENPLIQQSGDTINVMGYYNFGGPWQYFMSTSIDTIPLGPLKASNYVLIYHLTSYDYYTNDTTYSIDTDTLEFYVADPMAVSEQSVNPELKIFPNPSSGLISISGLSLEMAYEVAIISIYGQILQIEKISSRSNITLDSSKHPEGTYILSVKSENSIWNQKVILKN